MIMYLFVSHCVQIYYTTFSSHLSSNHACTEAASRPPSWPATSTLRYIPTCTIPSSSHSPIPSSTTNPNRRQNATDRSRCACTTTRPFQRGPASSASSPASISAPAPGCARNPSTVSINSPATPPPRRPGSVASRPRRTYASPSCTVGCGGHSGGATPPPPSAPGPWPGAPPRPLSWRMRGRTARIGAPRAAARPRPPRTAVAVRTRARAPSSPPPSRGGPASATASAAARGAGSGSAAAGGGGGGVCVRGPNDESARRRRRARAAWGRPARRRRRRCGRAWRRGRAAG